MLGLGFVGKIGFEYLAEEAVFEYSNNIRIRVGRNRFLKKNKKNRFFFELNRTFYI